MKKIISLILVFSLLLNACESTTGLSSSQAQQVQQQNQEVTNIVLGTSVFLLGLTAVLIAVIHHQVAKQKAQQKADEAKLQACVGKTKAEVYAIYGPPNSIVDDAQGQGGTILEYIHINTYGGDNDTPAYSVTTRKLFYLNKDNVVTSVKEDTQ